MVSALTGIMVIDLSLLLPGPYCTMLLADLGADVIKVEPPGGKDYTREIEPWLYECVNRNKKSVTIDLKTSDGQEVFYRLANEADVILEGFRPGVTSRLGVDYEVMRRINPRIIYCSISGYGQDGPYSKKSGHDINYLAVAGGLTLRGDPLPDPLDGHVQGMAIGDLSSGMFAAVSILAAVIARGSNGQGQYIDVSITDGIVSWMSLKAGDFFEKGRVPKREDWGEAHYGIFSTKDGKYISLGIIEDTFWQNLCKLLGWNDWNDDPRFLTYSDRNASRNLILQRLRQTLLTKSRDEWITILAEADVPCAPVNNVAEVFCDPQIVHRELLTRLAGTSWPSNLINFPVKLSVTPGRIRTRAPRLGQHTEEILERLGYSKQEISDLQLKRIISKT
ncbi:MAG: hypothetical protein A2157_19125 [Deltaproteobacteria bacterium RBG_16_47_11]|nr:MAG: hypothetical protein A2157_19125 [Deltaproteobacteria bacterium RBG_16_47_11]